MINLPCFEENIKSVNQFLDKLKPLAASKNATLSQLVIAWTLCQPGITIALVGARDTRQAIENARASEIVLTREETGFIDNELMKLVLENVKA